MSKQAQAAAARSVHEISCRAAGGTDGFDSFLRFSDRHIQSIRPEYDMLHARARAQARSRSADGFTLFRVAATHSGARVVRDAAEIARDRRDHYFIDVLLAGTTTLTQFNRSSRLEPGCYMLSAGFEPFTCEFPAGSQSEAISFCLPRAFVDQRMIIGERHCARLHGARTGLHRLAVDTLCLFEQSAWELSDDEFVKSARVIAELLLLALGESADPGTNDGSVRGAHLARAKYIVGQRLEDADWTLADLAGECGLSLRYLHELFRDERLSAYEYLKAERLQRARGLLERATPGETDVTDIAFRSGFKDLSHFSRSFKQAYSTTPRDVLRGAAARPGPAARSSR